MDHEYESDTVIRAGAHRVFWQEKCRKIKRNERGHRTGYRGGLGCERDDHGSGQLLPLGPVVMMDTPGIDDEGELGKLRVRKSCQVLNKTDAAVLVIDGTVGAMPEDMALLERIREKKIPYVIAVNKKEVAEEAALKKTVEQLSLEKAGSGDPAKDTGRVICVSAATGEGIPELKELIASAARTEEPEKYIVRDLLDPSDMAVLVVPIDKAAPKGRLILPQQQTIRDILEADAVSVVVKETELKNVLGQFREKPKLVITDSQAFEKVAAKSGGGYAGGYPAHIILHPFRQIQGRPGSGGERRDRAGYSGGRRCHPDQRGLHPPQAVRRYRDSEAAALDPGIYGERDPY